MADVDKPGLREAARAFQERNFALFWSGALLSNTGTWVQNITVPYVVFQITGSGFWVGAAVFFQLGPLALLSPFGGQLADRYDRRSILLLTQSGLALVALALWVVWGTGNASLPAVLALVALSGTVTGLNIPSWQAFVTELVPRDVLLNAVTLNSAQFNAARAFGPAIGGLVLSTLGVGAAFLINALSYGCVLAALALIRLPRRPRPEGARPTVWADLTATLGYVRGHRGMVAAFLAVIALGVLGQPIISLTVVFAEEIFEVGGLAYGAMAGAIGLGSVLATPLVAGRGSGLARSRLAIVAMITYGAALVAFAVSPTYAVAFGFLLVAGVGYLPIAATLNTSLQLQVDEDRRGKVLSVYITLFTLSMPVGALVQGVAFDLIGPRVTVAIAGTAFVAVSAWLWARHYLPHLDDDRVDADADGGSGEAGPLVGTASPAGPLPAEPAEDPEDPDATT